MISSSGYKIPPQKPSYTKIYTKHISLMLLYTSKLHSHLSRNIVHSAVMHAASHWCLYRPSWAMRHRCPAFLQPVMTGFNWIVKFLSADWQAQVRWWTEINWIWRRVPGLLHTETSTDTHNGLITATSMPCVDYTNTEDRTGVEIATLQCAQIWLLSFDLQVHQNLPQQRG